MFSINSFTFMEIFLPQIGKNTDQQEQEKRTKGLVVQIPSPAHLSSRTGTFSLSCRWEPFSFFCWYIFIYSGDISLITQVYFPYSANTFNLFYRQIFLILWAHFDYTVDMFSFFFNYITLILSVHFPYSAGTLTCSAGKFPLICWYIYTFSLSASTFSLFC